MKRKLSRNMVFLTLGAIAVGAYLFVRSDRLLAHEDKANRAPAAACSQCVPVKARTIARRFRAYARVEPVYILKVNAPLAGVVSGMRVLPGMVVKAGAIFTHLRGPAIAGLLAQRQAAVASARAAESAALKALAIERRQKASGLATNRQVSSAVAAAAEARATFDSANSRLRAAHEATILRAATAGTVLTVETAEGEHVQPGQTILTLQPAGDLWLKAQYFGADASAVRLGMNGRFLPASGAPPIAVKVRTIIGVVRPDGGESVGLVAAEPVPNWRNGEAGTVVLRGPPLTLAEVPTGALILSRGRWWVLVHTGKRNRPQAVVPGPSRGDFTLIESGIKPGAEVVAENAYLEFHRAFSQNYQPPD